MCTPINQILPPTPLPPSSSHTHPSSSSPAPYSTPSNSSTQPRISGVLYLDSLASADDDLLRAHGITHLVQAQCMLSGIGVCHPLPNALAMCRSRLIPRTSSRPRSPSSIHALPSPHPRRPSSRHPHIIGASSFIPSTRTSISASSVFQKFQVLHTSCTVSILLLHPRLRPTFPLPSSPMRTHPRHRVASHPRTPPRRTLSSPNSFITCTQQAYILEVCKFTVPFSFFMSESACIIFALAHRPTASALLLRLSAVLSRRFCCSASASARANRAARCRIPTRKSATSGCACAGNRRVCESTGTPCLLLSSACNASWMQGSCSSPLSFSYGT
ncbi:hypothetical protein B0H16DRAFT_1499474 [Mycena metata]|uniref:Uncharacterized protein n=1 Tax=Mycena metata TaxID=1033252 RepID=A0AAD7K6V6_9AGAR|nr:hypothetical protein B0H16DRAFT_1499474 [Mycena metata]